MTPNSKAEPAALSASRVWSVTFFLVLFVLAFAIRAHRITEPMLEFAPTRSYGSALIARSMYYTSNPAVPEWQRRIAQAAAPPLIEPPIMELGAAALYLVTGGEHLWIPRLMSIFIWCIGGIILYMIAIRLTSTDGAMFSLAFYLLLPFGIVATRGFQPDPLMVTVMLAGLLAILKHDKETTTKRFVIAALLCGAAVFVKPHCITILVCAFVGLATLRDGFRAWLKPGVWAFLGIILLPSAVYYGWNMLVSHSLAGPAGANFVPRNLLHGYYWRGWLSNLRNAVGTPAMLGILLGCCCVRERKTRLILGSLWIGYFLYGLAFNGGIWSHSYYQLSVVPLAALSLGPAAAAVFSAISSACTSRLGRTLLGAMLIVMLCLLAKVYAGLVYSPGWRARVSDAEEVGRLTGHTASAVFLAEDYAQPLMFYGNVAGMTWPDQAHLRFEALMGKGQTGADERLRTMINHDKPDYFIITAIKDYKAQPDLVSVLASYSVAARTKDYVIIDLRRKRFGG